MKNAPNLKYLPKDKFTEAIIFAGADAFAHAKGWEEGLSAPVKWTWKPLLRPWGKKRKPVKWCA